MKRILAVFLTLAMALNIAPVAAFAAADSDAASIVAVEETDETSSPQLDEETARAIASDPFLQAAYAQTEQEQTGQAEVDTSNMSVSATNSFGQLLVNGLGMDGENGSDLSSESRVIEITMNGSTAMVKYIVKKDANLVVGIYTDDSEQEMIASGTVAVQATPDNTASSIVEVPLSGEIPEHYTVKGFLLDKEDHAPLCREYTNAFYTENVEELEGATIDDFDSARAVNLDDDRTTNFGVVKQGVILLQEDEPENGAGENIVVLDDSENQIYQFENASAELLNLKQGNIIVYKYGENNLIIAHVADFEINGTTVTIYGDEDFQLEDVFSILKMDGENTTDKAIVDTETGDGKVSYIGTQEIETLDSTNEWEGKAEFSHVFKISTDDGKDEDSEEKPVSGSVEGTVSIKAAIKLKLRLCDDNKMVSLSFPMTEKFELEGAVEYKGELLKFPKITLPVYGCLSVGFEPQMVFKANASVAFKMDSTQMIGFEWSQKDGTQDISEAPVTSINFKLSGSIYLGFDMAPKAELGVGKVSLVKLKFKAEAGFELSAEERLGDQGTGLDEIHGCKNCYEGELEFKITLGVSLKILLYEPKIEITPFSHSFGKAYASADYGDFGWGECPHVKYRLTLKAGKAGAGATVKIQSNDSDTSSLYTETTLDADGNSTVYLPEREYRITANKGSMEFVKTIKLSRGTTVNIDLEQGSTGGNPGTTDPDTPDPDKPDPDNPDPDPTPPSETIVASGTCGDNLTWKLDDEGTLTISGKGAMTEWVNSDSAPWKTYSNTINKVVIQPGVTSIGGHAFSKCKNLTSITIPEGVTSIGSDAFSGCSSLMSITIPESVTSIGEDAFYGCENLRSITIPEGVTSIGWKAFKGCSRLMSITIPEGVTSIGDSAFEDCRGLTSISLPESVIKIGNYAFKSTALTGKFVIPSGVTKIGDGLFENCQKLTEVVIPDGITFIGPYAFKYTGITSFVIPDGIRTINVDTFYGTRLDRITIPVSVTAINPSAFGNEYVNGYVKEVHYTGTKSDWSRIGVGGANERLREATIHCTDGDIVPNTENSITTGTASASDSKFQATFADAKAGKEYVVIVSRSDSDPLSADNLIYINQITADADGELAVPFITAADAAEMTYVVACAQDDATVEPGQPDKPNQPGQPDQPSSGDDGGGAAIILIGGVAAVAAVAGVVLMMPVKVEGTVKLADQPVANATVQVLKNGNVAAQTTTDANGHFTVKVKRGGYTLRVQWTDASGQPVTRTVDFKAPNGNLNVAA